MKHKGKDIESYEKKTKTLSSMKDIAEDIEVFEKNVKQKTLKSYKS